MTSSISIYNPTVRARAGYVTVLWSYFRQHNTEFGDGEKSFVLCDSENREIEYQIDTVDPDDPSRTCLIFAIDYQIPPAPENWSRPSEIIGISAGQPHFYHETSARLISSGLSRGIELTNGVLTTYINFSAYYKHPGKLWYAGSATTVQLHDRINDREILAFGNYMEHDPEKRCMQIDHLYLPSHSASPEFDKKVNLYNEDYDYVTHSNGPVRASVTIKSKSFNYVHVNTTAGTEHTIPCRLYRVISLYADADYIIEELYLKAEHNIKPPQFMVRYYSHMNFGHLPDIFQFADIPGWFAIGADLWRPAPGYGFGTTSRAGAVAYPHRDTSVLYNEPVHEKEFSWLLFPCTYARNLHVFMRRNGRDFDDETGRRWHDIIYRGLQARMGS